MNIRYTAVIAAISEGCGFEYFELHDCAVDSKIFCGFIRKLHQINYGKQITIVMDNLAAHKTQEAVLLMKELSIEWIWVVPYSPEYNAIELPFSQVKKAFKEEKLRSMVKGNEFDQYKTISRIFEGQKVKYIDSCVKHAIKALDERILSSQ